VKADAPYVTESILAPQAKIVQGFPPSMPPFAMKPADINALIEFMKSISANTSAADMMSTTAPASQPASTAPAAPTVPGTTPTGGSTLTTPTTTK
jgi:hypothetical protein